MPYIRKASMMTFFKQPTQHRWWPKRQRLVQLVLDLLDRCCRLADRGARQQVEGRSSPRGIALGG
jgi:hypothetical protein